MKKALLGSITLLSILVLGACSSIDNKEATKKEPGNYFVKEVKDTNFDGKILKGNTYSVKITKHKIIHPGEKGNENGDEPAFAIWFDTMVAPDYDNSTPITPNDAWLENFTAFQNTDSNKTNELNVGLLPDITHYQNQVTAVKPGSSISSSIAYKLTDLKTPVTLSAQNITGDNYGETKIEIK